MRIIFLHIPKTAGQSVHAGLIKAFGEKVVCPARVNDQLKGYSISELNRYRVFSGHLDWSLLDCVKGPRYTFTVLRKPVDRILSFYFYLRKQAELLDPDALRLPQNQGMRAAKELSPDEYFSGGQPHLRRFLDDHYDNFYTYYFAGRRYTARGEIIGLVKRGVITKDRLIEIAKENMAQLDAVFTLDNISKAFEAICEISGTLEIDDIDCNLNKNQEIAPEDRHEQLLRLGATDKTFRRLSEFCDLDNELWEIYK